MGPLPIASIAACVLWFGAAPGQADTIFLASSLSFGACIFSIAGQQVPVTTPTVAPIKACRPRFATDPRLTLRFVPEPSALSLLGAGAGALLLLGHWKRG